MDSLAYYKAIEFIESLDRTYPENSNVGWLYVGRNKEIRKPLLKIGMTSRPPHARATELGGAGVPGLFEIVYFVHLADSRLGESMAHQSLAAYRYQPNKEFFDVSINSAVQVLDQIAAQLPLLRSQLNRGSRNPRSKPVPQAFPIEIVACRGCGKRNRIHRLAIPINARCGGCSQEVTVE